MSVSQICVTDACGSVFKSLAVKWQVVTTKLHTYLVRTVCASSNAWGPAPVISAQTGSRLGEPATHVYASYSKPLSNIGTWPTLQYVTQWMIYLPVKVQKVLLSPLKETFCKSRCADICAVLFLITVQYLFKKKKSYFII